MYLYKITHCSFVCPHTIKISTSDVSDVTKCPKGPFLPNYVHTSVINLQHARCSTTVQRVSFAGENLHDFRVPVAFCESFVCENQPGIGSGHCSTMYSVCRVLADDGPVCFPAL